MKINKFVLLITVFFSTTFLFAQKVTITGKVIGDAADLAQQIVLLYDGKSGKMEVDKTAKTFKGAPEISEPQFVQLVISGSNNFIYLIPNETLKLTIDKSSNNASTVTIDKGNIQRINAIMDVFYGTIDENSVVKTNELNWTDELFSKPEIVQKAIAETRKAIEKEQPFLDKNAPTFKQDFEIFANAFTHYISADTYSYTQIETILQELSKTQVKSIFLNIPYYKNFLVDITNAYASRKLENYNIEFDKLDKGYIPNMISAEAALSYIPNQDIINILFFDKANQAILTGAKNTAFVDFLLANITNDRANKLKVQYADIIKKRGASETVERPDAFDFELHDANGKVYKLADFKGKMLYIDFWASWCAPCKMQMPYLREIEKEYEGKDIVFANVSLDDTKEAWLKGVKEENLHGTVLHAEGAFKNPFPVNYQINAIPRFMLIDSDGKMIDDNAPRPQSKKELLALIDADLYKSALKGILEKHFAALGASKLIDNPNVLEISSMQNMMGIEIKQEKRYSYPKTFRYDFLPVDNNPMFRKMFGADFYAKRYMLMKNNIASGNIKGIDKISGNWTQQLPGLELFLLAKVDKEQLELASENSNNDENSFVIQIASKGETSKFFIDKETYLIKKILTTITSTPRSGGGTITASITYTDYKSVDGIMIPHHINMNNYINITVTEAKFQPLDESVFDSNAILENLKK